MTQGKNIPHGNAAPGSEGNQASNLTPGNTDLKQEKATTIPEAQTQTSNLEHQTTNMEVHKHPHHVTHKKKWPEYILEFLMLFLAVFLGFVAENIREHSVEKRIEKEYMHSLIQDLNADIQDINRNLQLGSIVTEKLDSLIYFLNEEDPVKNTQSLYRLAAVAGRIVQVVFTDRTSSQLKNSGNMRLVRNSNLSDSIQSYWTQVRIDEGIADRIQDIQGKSGDIAVQLYSNKYYEKRDPSNPLVVSVKRNARFISNDLKLFAQLSNRANTRLFVLYNYLLNLQETKEQAARLIELTKKEYHLK
jgi:hypothetical protein